MGGVHVREVGRLGRQFIMRHDGAGGADRNACAAIQTVSRIHEELRGFLEVAFCLLGVDGVRRASFYTQFIFNASIGNYVGHTHPNAIARPQSTNRKEEVKLYKRLFDWAIARTLRPAIGDFTRKRYSSRDED
jgi:hypothetical protein